MKLLSKHIEQSLNPYHFAPQTTEAAQYSIPYTVAIVFCYGVLKPCHEHGEYLQNEKTLDLAKKIQIRLADDLEALFPEKRPARVIVKLKNGDFKRGSTLS